MGIAVTGKSERPTTTNAAWRLDDSAVAALAAGRHSDPFAVLGPHRVDGGHVVRAFVAGAETLSLVEATGAATAMTQRDPDGVFEVFLAHDPGAYTLAAANGGGRWRQRWCWCW